MSEALFFITLVREVAAEIGAYRTGAQSGNTGGSHDELTVPSLKDFAFDDERFRWWYAERSDESEWRLVKSTTLTDDNKLALSRGFTDAITDGQTVRFYGILDPTEWRTACKTALASKFRISRISITAVAGQREYALTATASWLHIRGQIIRITIRDISSGATKPLEDEMPGYRLIEEDLTVKLLLPKPLEVVANRTLEIEARQYFDAPNLADDSALLLVPRLYHAACKESCLEAIFTKLGPAAKRFYGMMMVRAGQEHSKEEARWQEGTVKRDLTKETADVGGDPNSDVAWGW